MDPLEKRQTFEKKSHNAKKLKGGPFGIFKHPLCCKMSKILKGDPSKRKKIRKKASQCQKTERGTLSGFLTSILTQNSKKLKGGPFWGENNFRKKSLAVPKKLKGETLWCRTVWYVTGKNRKNFLLQFVRPNLVQKFFVDLLGTMLVKSCG